MDQFFCDLLNTRELAEWISQCDNLNHLEFMDFCPLDIMQKLSKQLLRLRTNVKLKHNDNLKIRKIKGFTSRFETIIPSSPYDDNYRLITKFTNLRSLQINIKGHSDSKDEGDFLERILELEYLETLILEHFRWPLKIISSGVEKGKLRLLKKLIIRPCSYRDILDPVLQDDFRLLNDQNGLERGNEKNEAVYVMRIVKTLQFLSYFEIRLLACIRSVLIGLPSMVYYLS